MKKGLIFLALLTAGCATTGTGDLATLAAMREHPRRFLIAGMVSSEEAASYARRYQALARGVPSRGPIADFVRGSLTAASGGVSPGYLKGVLEDLRSINASGQSWEIIVVASGRKAFLLALQRLGENGLGQASGTVHLVGVSGPDPESEQFLLLASGGSFKLTYGAPRPTTLSAR